MVLDLYGCLVAGLSSMLIGFFYRVGHPVIQLGSDTARFGSNQVPVWTQIGCSDRAWFGHEVWTRGLDTAKIWTQLRFGHS